MGNTQESMRETDPEKSKEKEEDSSFTCEICIEPMSQNKRFKNKKRCTHPFCLDCIAEYIEVKVEDHATEVKCPGLNCEKLLDPLSCRPILSPQVFEKWSDVLCNAAILKFDKVYCPFNHCSTLILNECKDNIEKTKCPNCKDLFCFKCKGPWHEGFQCSENGEPKDTNDFLFAKLAERKKWKKCPSCNHIVELLSGCPDVKCRCGTRFCYICGGKCSNHLRWCQRNVNCILLRRIMNLIFILALIFIFGLLLLRTFS